MTMSERKPSVTEFDPLPMRRQTRRRGFTLTHLLGVIVLLAIPATILFPMIATPSASEAATDDDTNAVPKLEQQTFIKSMAVTQPSKAGLPSQLAAFRTWVRDTQGADVSYSTNDGGRTLKAYFAVPSTRGVAITRARRLHWYYTFLRQAYVPGAQSTVLVVDKSGRTIAACHGAFLTRSSARIPGVTLLRWLGADAPFSFAIHRTMDSSLRKLAAATHRL